MSEKIISQKIEIYIRKNISQIVYKYISQIVGKYIRKVYIRKIISEIDGKLYPKKLYPRSWEIISENKWHPQYCTEAGIDVRVLYYSTGTKRAHQPSGGRRY